jgi:hypothetical protein
MRGKILAIVVAAGLLSLQGGIAGTLEITAKETGGKDIPILTVTNGKEKSLYMIVNGSQTSQGLNAPVSITFTGIATTANGSVTNLSWNFGNNADPNSKNSTNGASIPVTYSSLTTPQVVTCGVDHTNQDSSGKTIQCAKASDVVSKITILPVEIVPDFNRDGRIDNNDSGKVTVKKQFRWWIDDSGESGDIASGDNDIPGSGGNESLSYINGREDLINYFPLYLNIKNLLTVLPPKQYTYQLSQADSGVSFAYTDLKPSSAGDFLTNNEPDSLKNNVDVLAYASAEHVPSSGSIPLKTDWLNQIGDFNKPGGVLLLKGTEKTTAPLKLNILKGSRQITSIDFPLSINVIGNMYRTINLRSITRGSTTISTNDGQPLNYPDSLCTNNKMVVFVHGFNVNEAQATAWFAESFKRLFQSGSHAMFTGVAWNGDNPSYWQDVANAFNTAQAFASKVNALPGSSKVVIAHSLGNMVVSTAINDMGLNPANYFMLNTAIPMEAFDPSQYNPNQANPMVNPAYYGYNTGLWASCWWNLFPSTDGRSGLKWKNRFPNVTGVNFYSSGDDVLDNGDPSIFNPSSAQIVWSKITTGSYFPHAWYIQEYAKGTTTLQAQFIGKAEGGWGFNTNYNVETTYYDPNKQEPPATIVVTMPPKQANQMIATNEEIFKTNTFFTPFKNTKLTGANGSSEASIPSVRAQVLGAAIPALSYAVGRNAFRIILNTNNVDMNLLHDKWPQQRKINARYEYRWLHSDVKNVAYPFTYKVWNKLIYTGKLN